MKNLLALVYVCLVLFSCAKQEKEPEKDLLKEYNKANDFYDEVRYDSAFYYYNKVALTSRDSLLVGKSLFNMA
uniref:hypothetical protein n=1 Tax=Pedobacter sp. TaxID=1411316 RepID=UPI003D7F57DF